MIDKKAIIHPSSIVEDGAIISKNVYIGPFCYVTSRVKIGENTKLKSHVIICGNTKIGCDNEIFQFSSIGEVNQDLKYRGEETKVEIGNRNFIRENCTVHRGTLQGGGLTKIGDDNLLMANVHIAHDCYLGNYCVISNNGTLGGHVKLNNFVVVGGMTAIHQFCQVGDYVMIGGCSGVSQDIPPYFMAQGNHAVLYGINLKGLKKRGFDVKSVNFIKKAYKILYCSGKSFEESKKELIKLSKQDQCIKILSDFLEKSSRSNRGIIKKNFLSKEMF